MEIITRHHSVLGCGCVCPSLCDLMGAWVTCSSCLYDELLPVVWYGLSVHHLPPVVKYWVMQTFPEFSQVDTDLL